MSAPNLNRLLELKKQLEARIQQTRNKEIADEKKRATRRMVLAGEYMIRLAEGNLPRIGEELIQAGILQPRDYHLFGIEVTEPVIDNSQKQEQDHADIIVGDDDLV